MSRCYWSVLAGVALTLPACMPSPTLAPSPSSSSGTSSGTVASADSGHAGAPHSSVKPYNEVITKEAKTRSGMFRTHRVGDNLFFEIPPAELNRDMLLVGRYARAAVVDASNPFGAYGGDEFGERTLRWERVGNRVFLRSPSFAIMADTALPIYKAVSAGNYAPIIAVFDVVAYGRDSAAVIDVTRLYTSNTPEFSAIRGSVDERRSYIENAVAFPDNIEVEATQTGTQQSFGPAAAFARSRDGTQSVLAHWSMVRLPGRPMTPRIGDDRVGFFGVTRTDFGTNQYRSVERQYIARWRLEKKFPDSTMSEPIKPIVYYIDPATPDVWKPWIRRAVLEWQPAFEAAGFRNAIVPMDAPATDPDWSPDDVRHTVIRWLPSTNENALGPHISDPRTGEILNGSIRMFHNVLNLQRDWYFTQVAPLDPRAQRWPMPDSLMGRLLQSVVAHEIGHTLGLYHNHKASSMYPADSVRSRTWVHRMGYSPSIMDYARYNYVAQPEDSIAVNDLVPRVGTYDKFAIEWGYKPIPGARTPESERGALDAMARMQDTVPWFRFGNLAESREDNPDPGDEMEAVGDADAVKSTALGVKNIRRIMPMLIGVTQKAGEDNSDLEEIYDRLVTQWTLEMGHVVHVVGGAEVQTKYGSQPGAVYKPISRARQMAAVNFLNEQLFTTPRFFLDESVTRRIEPSGSLARVNAAQARVLRELLDDARMQRMIEFDAHAPRLTNVYTLPEMLSDVRRGIWSELAAPRVAIDAFRRNLQRAYLDQLDGKINTARDTFGSQVIVVTDGRVRPSAGPAAMSDVRAAMRGELIALRTQIDGAMPRAANAETRAHLLDARTQIDRILDPNS
ncbi:MAG: zinc-dependent metalloprotease [Gemmatimonadaceae bacterium]